MQRKMSQSLAHYFCLAVCLWRILGSCMLSR